MEFDERLSRMDLSLFDAIPSQTSTEDRRSLLTLQAAVRRKYGRYAYLEIGSHLGGTIQPHIVDPLCSAIYSVDSRPFHQPDERGEIFSYENNSTIRMLQHLEHVPGRDLSKLTTFDCTAAEVDPGSIPVRPSLCFVDAEHTDQAVVSDFQACWNLTRGCSVYCFHDSWILYRGLSSIITRLERESVPLVALYLPSFLFVIDTSNSGVLDEPQVAARLRDGWRGYLESMNLMDTYRRFYIEHTTSRASGVATVLASSGIRSDNPTAKEQNE